MNKIEISEVTVWEETDMELKKNKKIMVSIPEKKAVSLFENKKDAIKWVSDLMRMVE